jgi:hypothetical protein
MTEPLPSGLDSSPALDQLFPALLEVQRAIGPARKTALNPHLKTRYADLAEVWECCSGPLHEHGFVVLYPLAGQEISCLLAHRSGQWIRSWLSIPATKKLPSNLNAEPIPLTPQDLGSVITYYRRYLLSALLAITTEDDDAQAVSGRDRASRRPQPAPDDGPLPRPIVPKRDLPRGSAPRPAPDDGTHPRPANGHAQAAPSQPAPRETWAAVVARIEQASKTWWENELTIEGIPREKWKELPNQWAITHHLAKHAVEKGVVLPDALEKPEKPGTKDRAKVLKVVSDLYARAPRKIEAHVMAYLLREENRLRAELGMPERTDENSAQDGVEHINQETPGGREPGEDG